MVTEATRADKLGERLRDVGFSERAVALIVEQVEGLREENGLAEAALPYELEKLVTREKTAEKARSERAEAADPVDAPPKTSPAARLVDPDLPVAAAGAVTWLLVLLSSWTGLTCEAQMLGVGDLEILAEGCAAAGPGLFSIAGVLVTLWLVAPAAWNLIAGKLDLPRPDIAQSLRAAVIWGGFSLLLVMTLVLASMG